MTIKVSTDKAITALMSFVRLSEENRLPAATAWKVSEIIEKLQDVNARFGKLRERMVADANASIKNGAFVYAVPKQEEDESDAAFLERMTRTKVAAESLESDLANLLQQENEIDVELLPLSLLTDSEKMPEERRMRFSPNDMRAIRPFIKA